MDHPLARPAPVAPPEAHDTEALPDFAAAGPAEFREAMARLAAGVCIVTSRGPAGLAGCTATAVCSVTDDPPTLIVCLNRASRNNAVIRANGTLCVNILGAGQETLARHFADSSLTVEERFAKAAWLAAGDNAPALKEAAAALDCRISRVEEVGSHSVFFCTIRSRYLAEDRGGLAYHARHFHALG